MTISVYHATSSWNTPAHLTAAAPFASTLLDSQARPQRLDLLLHFRVHLDFIGPEAGQGVGGMQQADDSSVPAESDPISRPCVCVFQRTCAIRR